MERELTLTGIAHPEFIGDEWQLVDHPTVRPIQQGEPTLGWEGDERLAMYLHKPTQSFVLWRLERNEQYEPICHSQKELTPAAINMLIRRLIEIDGRRGANPLAVVENSIIAHERELARVRQDAVADFADKLEYGLSRSHLPGVDVPRSRHVLSRR